ncbi:MAG: hypothetical protein N0E48_27270, partial [Candidatus Thiodiazotropha endolucinida]|nr:hypothetical protein [Candidatus Thiodiazotropha taylori]MCW4347025.1 hypothetical protein [Candidatus Thiodiazotropha endolucinida]
EVISGTPSPTKETTSTPPRKEDSQEATHDVDPDQTSTSEETPTKTTGNQSLLDPKSPQETRTGPILAGGVSFTHVAAKTPKRRAQTNPTPQTPQTLGKRKQEDRSPSTPNTPEDQPKRANMRTSPMIPHIISPIVIDEKDDTGVQSFVKVINNTINNPSPNNPITSNQPRRPSPSPSTNKRSVYITISKVGGRMTKGQRREIIKDFSGHMKGQVTTTLEYRDSSGVTLQVPRSFCKRAEQYKNNHRLNFDISSKITQDPNTEGSTGAKPNTPRDGAQHNQSIKPKTRSTGVLLDFPKQSDPAQLKERLTKNGHKVSKARRILSKRKEPTKVVKLTFDSQVAPTTVTLDGKTINVHPCRIPYLRCYTCQKHGHTIKNCPSKIKICAKCSQRHPENKCTAGPNQLKCPNCRGRHSAAHPQCETFLSYKRKVNAQNREIKNNWEKRRSMESAANPQVPDPPKTSNPPNPGSTQTQTRPQNQTQARQKNQNQTKPRNQSRPKQTPESPHVTIDQLTSILIEVIKMDNLKLSIKDKLCLIGPIIRANIKSHAPNENSITETPNRPIRPIRAPNRRLTALRSEHPTPMDTSTPRKNA